MLLLIENSNLPVSALQHPVRALLSQLPEDPSAAIITVKSDAVPAVTINGQRRLAEGPAYNPAIVYILELCTVLALRDEESMIAVGQEVSGALQNIVRDAASYHPTMVSRTVYYLLTLLHASYVSNLLVCLNMC